MTKNKAVAVSAKKVPITVAMGDGIGPEIMAVTLDVLKAAGAHIKPELVTIGKKAFHQGIMNGVTDEAWESIRRTKILLKAPLTTPQGGGYKSVNVTMRKTFGMFANVRPVRTYEPFVPSKHKKVDMVIVRENEEDLYAGIEYRQSLHTCQSLKLISRVGTERILRYAFNYARSNGRKKVTLLVKDNIMKIADGLYHNLFDAIGKEYPELEKDVMIVDIGMARVADTPEAFDVIVTQNLYGDIVSDIASQISGSVGVAGSMNLGSDIAMFEAVHGSAPDIAGKGIANPSALLNGAVLMLEHIGQQDIGAKIANAWLKTVEDGFGTGDIAQGKEKTLDTKAFGQKIITNLGEKPKKLTPRAPAKGGKGMQMAAVKAPTKSAASKQLIGVDIFMEWPGEDPEKLGKKVQQIATMGLKFQALAARGLKMYPLPPEEPKRLGVSDLWRARFICQGVATRRDIRNVLSKLETLGIQWVSVENLFKYNGKVGYSQIQGE